MNSSRVLGSLLCIGSALIAIAHVYFGYLTGSSIIPHQGLAFSLPVTFMLLITTGLGFWLGWIMSTTGEAEPSPTPTVDERAAKTKSED